MNDITPKFLLEPDTLFLAVIDGKGLYETKVVRATELVNTYLETFGGNPEESDEWNREKATGILSDPDQWRSDDTYRPCRFHADCETGYLEFLLLDTLSIVGALPTRPDVDDGAPDCPMMHVLHPNAAGENPRLLYGVPVKRQNQ